MGLSHKIIALCSQKATKPQKALISQNNRRRIFENFS
jgi:hypothetical protein